MMDAPLLALTRPGPGLIAETTAAANMRQLIQLRWIAVAGQTLAILLVHYGFGIALPVVETRGAPLVFRHWTPGNRMVRGDWNIPVPPPEADVLIPDFALAPCLGWDADCYRLGWGGGYFDRTLAVLDPKPITIGVALAGACLPTIYPQPHDIPLDLILTEDGVAAERTDPR